MNLKKVCEFPSCYLPAFARRMANKTIGTNSGHIFFKYYCRAHVNELLKGNDWWNDTIYSYHRNERNMLRAALWKRGVR